MLIAAVVKSADTRDLKSLGVKSVPVQVRSAASHILRGVNFKFAPFIFAYEITFTYKRAGLLSLLFFFDKNLWG